MPLLGFLLTLAAASMWAAGNIVTRAVARCGPINQFAFVVWASLVPPLPFSRAVAADRGAGQRSLRARAFSLRPSPPSPTSPGRRRCSATACGRACSSRYPANQVAPFSLLVPLVG
jgi:O-acetylserine/cysteine efflux transporter